MHASELTKGTFCPREWALMDLTKYKAPDQFISTSLATTFSIGRLVQDMVIDWLVESGRAVTDWRCVACKQLHELTVRPVACHGCGCTALAPEEHRFRSQETGIGCGIDCFARTNGDRFKLVEVKSIDKEEFKKLLMPIAEHRQRTNLYLRIVADSGHPFADKVDLDSAIVLYVSKGGFGCLDKEVEAYDFPDDKYSPFKEYAVARKDEDTDDLWIKAGLYHRFRTWVDHPMPAGVCDNAQCERAKKCPVSSACFAADAPQPAHPVDLEEALA